MGPLVPGNAGVPGYLFHPGNDSLVTLFRNLGLRNLRIGGGSVDQPIPAGTGRDGFTGIDNLFAFAAGAGVKVIYTLRLLNPAANPVPDLKSADAQAAGYIWARYRDNVASFAIGNEPDWHDFHSYAGPPAGPGDLRGGLGGAGQRLPVLPGQLAQLRRRGPGGGARSAVVRPGPGAYSTMTYTPDPDSGRVVDGAVRRR